MPPMPISYGNTLGVIADLLNPHADPCIPSRLQLPLCKLLRLIHHHSTTDDSARQIRAQPRAIIPVHQVPPHLVIVHSRSFRVMFGAFTKGGDELELGFPGFGVEEAFKKLREINNMIKSKRKILLLWRSRSLLDRSPPSLIHPYTRSLRRDPVLMSPRTASRSARLS